MCYGCYKDMWDSTDVRDMYPYVILQKDKIGVQCFFFLSYCYVLQVAESSDLRLYFIVMCCRMIG